MAPVIFQKIVDWKVELDGQFQIKIEIWDELRMKYNELAKEPVNEQISRCVIGNIADGN